MKNRLDLLPDELFRQITLYLDNFPASCAAASRDFHKPHFCEKCGEVVRDEENLWTIVTNPMLLRHRKPDQIHCKACFRLFTLSL